MHRCVDRRVERHVDRYVEKHMDVVDRQVDRLVGYPMALCCRGQCEIDMEKNVDICKNMDRHVDGCVIHMCTGVWMNSRSVRRHVDRYVDRRVDGHVNGRVHRPADRHAHGHVGQACGPGMWARHVGPSMWILMRMCTMCNSMLHGLSCCSNRFLFFLAAAALATALAWPGPSPFLFCGLAAAGADRCGWHTAESAGHRCVP